MINLNVKAKPYHPCEEIVGSDLLYEFQKVRLFGSHAYMAEPPPTPKDCIALLHFRKNMNSMIGHLTKRFGWKAVGLDDGDFLPPPGFRVVTKEGSKLLITQGNEAFYQNCSVMEALKIFELKHGDQHKAIAFYHVLQNGAKVKNGQIDWEDGPHDPDEAPQAAPQPVYQWGNPLNLQAHVGQGPAQVIAQLAGANWQQVNLVVDQGIEAMPPPIGEHFEF